MDIPPQPVGIYGWRKRCLYSLLLVLMVMVIINLALTIWILRVLDFSIDGMGKLRIVPKGIRLEGEAEFLRPLYVQEIRAEEDQTLRMESFQSIKFQARDQNHQHSGSVVLGDNKLQVACDEFEVVDSQGKLLMSVTEKNFTVGMEDMVYVGEAVFDWSVRTSSVLAPHNQSLKLQSEEEDVEISGKGGVTLVSDAGTVQLLSEDSVRVDTSMGSILIQTNKVYLQNLDSDQSKGEVYQLCMCGSNGRLFYGAANGHCQAHDVCDES